MVVFTPPEGQPRCQQWFVPDRAPEPLGFRALRSNFRPGLEVLIRYGLGCHGPHTARGSATSLALRCALASPPYKGRLHPYTGLREVVASSATCCPLLSRFARHDAGGRRLRETRFARARSRGSPASPAGKIWLHLSNSTSSFRCPFALPRSKNQSVHGSVTV